MRVVMFVKERNKGYVPTPDTLEMMEAMGRFNDELRNADILIAGRCPNPTGPSEIE